MKKFISISMFSIAFLVVSCQKQAIVQNDVRPVDAPTWRSASAPSLGSDAGTFTGGGSGITDPNNDPDMNSKKVNKN